MAAAQSGITPRVSVITIFYNAEAHFREAIDSVLAQDFEDFELLLVDDGSTDSSTAIAKEYAKRDRRVRYLEHSGHVNRGMSATRNLGVAEARADLVAFIDADDRWHPSKLGEQVALMERLSEADAVGGTVRYWGSDNEGTDRIVPTGHVRDRIIPPGEATVELYPLGKSDAPSMSDLMFRRSAILGVGGFEEAFRGAYEDQAFLAKFYLNSALYITDRLWSDYRIHDDSCMAKVGRSQRYHDARRSFLEWFERHLQTTHHASDPGIRLALERALKPYRSSRGRLVEAAKSVPFAVPLVRSLRAAYRRLRPLVAPGPAILMYHRIADESFDPWALAVSPANFADQLEWIARNRTILPLYEFVELNRLGKLPRNAIAVTFDDGYACNSETAAPLLQRFGLPATIFISPELIRRGGEFWWDELGRIVLSDSSSSLRVAGIEMPLGKRESGDSEWPGGPARTPRQHAYREIWARLHGKEPEVVATEMAQLREQSGTTAEPRESHRLLTAKEIRALSSSGLVSFGSHAMTHASLPNLSAGEQESEIGESVAACEALSGQRPRTFAYPYGDHVRELEPFVESAGFVCACKADGWFVTLGSNPFALPRIFVGNWDSGQLALRLGRP
jgi:glycosyltransferase involved in cell wall biosynthesis/peptidoglycan/xylan/chitin deacetylase (PgdA/CDA1 family)